MTAVATAGSAPADRTPATGGASLWALGALLAIANFLAVLDTSIANVSVPNIAGSLGASTSQGTWVITSYAVAEAIMVPLTGWLAMRFGGPRVFVLSILGFGITSALCGLAPNLGSLTLFRVLQGFAGGPLMPLSQTLLFLIFPPKQRPAAMGLWAVTTLVAPILGPVLGGYLCDTFGWQAIFWVNVPIAFAAAVVLWRALKPYEERGVAAKFDVVGLVLLVGWVGALQLMLDLGKEHDWFANPMIVGLAAVALVGFLAFLIWELTAENPVVDLRIFRYRGFSVAMVTLAIAFGGFFATNVLTPLWLQNQMGYTATWAGYVTGMVGVLAVFAAPIASQLSVKVDPRKLIFVGVAGLGVITLFRGQATPDMTFWQIAIWLLISGAFMPLFFMPLTNLALGSVEPEETASASGLMNFIRTMAGAVAVSLVNTTWDDAATRNQAELAGAMTDAQTTVDALSAQTGGQEGAIATLTQMVHGQAVAIATNQVFLAVAFLFVVAAALIWLAPRPKHVADTSMAH
ncbi:DHA2 family efflux MFS transporter permease subunit [Phenylobacterium sp.]|jgi:DHA2 family multidrug resistance protein|uniref:DHA2 family efflux MFS transporter permease subunit n=1 Tax=Phenylobacterium sp. TaxID=1871053 RepID=UPI002F9504ED